MRAFVAFAMVAAATAAQAASAPKPAAIATPTPAATSTSNPASRKGSDEDLAREAAADAKRDELIRDLKTMIPKVQEGQQRADLVFQLAELWWEKARFASLLEAREFDDRYGAWLSARQKDEKAAGAEPRPSSQRSDAFRREALALYQTILRTYPTYPRQDELLFVVAYNQYEMGRKDEAIRTYTELIQRYPQSRFVPDAYVQIGEHWFQENELDKARVAFERAASFKLPRLYAFSLYKLAWCDYNAQKYLAAIEKFKLVVEHTEQQSSDAPRDRIQLKNEAMKDLVLPFTQLDAVESAAAWYMQKGGSNAVDYVHRLASTYFDTGKYDQAIRLYRMLEVESPTNVRAPAWQQKILLAYDKLNKRDKVAQEMKRLVAEYGPRSAWAAANAGQAAALAEANDLAESALRELVQDYHQEAIKTKSVATYRLARDIYRQYLETFPGSESAYNLRFYFAEILYALEDWDAAAEQYAKVVELDAKGRYAQKAAYDTILALEKSIAIAKGKLKKRDLAGSARVDEGRAKGEVEESRAVQIGKVSKDAAEQPIPELERKLIAACEKYLMTAPGAKDEIVIRYKAAFVYYQRQHSIEAAKRFGEIILRWPTDPWSQKAADLSLDILNTKEQWLALAELAQKFHADQRLSSPGSEFEKRVAKLAEGARFKHAMEVYEKQKDYAQAAKLFQGFVAQYPQSDYAAAALNNSVVIAEKADQLDLVIAAAERLLRDHPRADEAVQKPAMLSLASAYERSARFPEAIRWYEQYASRWPSDPRAPDQLFNAALWREGLGDEAGALAGWQRYVKVYGTRPDAPKIAFNIGIILERQKEWRKAADHWAAFQREHGHDAAPGQLLLARYKEALALRELRKDDASAVAVLADVAQRFQKLPEAERLQPVVDAAAHARLLGIEPAFQQFLAIQFHSTRQKDLVSTLKLKNERLAKLLEAYTEVIRFGSAKWSEAALTRLGEAYRNFNKGLLEAPMPRGLDPEQQDLYRTTLESQALPLEDKAVDAFEKAVETSSRTGFYSEWTIRAQDSLREYKPDAFGELHQPALLGSEAAGAVRPEGAGLQAAAGGGN